MKKKNFGLFQAKENTGDLFWTCLFTAAFDLTIRHVLYSQVVLTSNNTIISDEAYNITR